MLRELALPGEAMTFEHRNGSIVAKAARKFRILNVIRIALDQPAAEAGNFGERTVERGGRHAFSAMA